MLLFASMRLYRSGSYFYLRRLRYAVPHWEKELPGCGATCETASVIARIDKSIGTGRQMRTRWIVQLHETVRFWRRLIL